MARSKKKSKGGIGIYKLLWQHTEPVSASVDSIFFNGDSAVIAGEFSSKMVQTGKIVNALFFMQIAVESQEIV